MTRRSGATTRSRRAAVEQQVLGAVERLLTDGESFTALPVGRIADEAGMARTTFYGHFPDKSTLLMRLTETATAELFARAAGWAGDDDGTREEHVAVVQDLIAEYRAHAPLLQALVEVAAYESEVAAFWHRRIDDVADVLRRRIGRDRRAGRSAADGDPRITASMIVWGTERSIAHHVATAPPSADAAFARGVAAATWTALGLPT
ncbi:TetR/AcrR family transcriptional regulator [Paraconexibacter sp.]|uniref:TetR/AcrR family transcriptional regulator n=2 Tax=Paraconexibacter sp. TaxID=2949640 RepID=UPI003568FD26